MTTFTTEDREMAEKEPIPFLATTIWMNLDRRILVHLCIQFLRLTIAAIKALVFNLF
ncbi:hypothetical protein [Polynucleobacter necessarius]|uniref:hypothetical protein n=1 Tax=Polynucleobacter necessarius TaxID=576610 RepID=UPI0013B063B9|nr:hypothetical protein [Polynucleobacter necessarius]